jgi:serine/threonine-protein kinase
VVTLRKTVPPNVAAALSKALEKVPADRFETAKAFSDALANPAFTTHTAGIAPDTHKRHGVSRSTFAATAVVAVLAAAGLVWALSKQTSIDAPDGPVVRVAVDLPQGERLYSAASGSTIGISPQGDRVAYVSQGTAGAHLMIRRTGELIARELTAAVVTQPTFSPDGRWIAYVDGTQIQKVSVDGGSSQSLASGLGNIRGLSWTVRDTILIGSDAGILALPSKGGTPRRIPDVDSTGQTVYPVMLPDGKTIAYTTGATTPASQCDITLVAPHDGTRCRRRDGAGDAGRASTICHEHRRAVRAAVRSRRASCDR